MCLKEIKKRCKEDPRITIILIFVILLAFSIGAFFSFSFTPPIDWEPQKLDVSLSPGKNYTQTISIRANEKGYVGVTLSGIDNITEWVSSKKNVSVDVNITGYINVEFKIPKNATPGEYKGALLFSGDIVSGKDSERRGRIPIILKIKPLGNNS